MPPPDNNCRPTDSEAIESPDNLPRLPEIELPDDSSPLPEFRATGRTGDAVDDKVACYSEGQEPLPPFLNGRSPFEQHAFEVFPDPSFTREPVNGNREVLPPEPPSKDLLEGLCEAGFEVTRLQTSDK